jgi:hypothetical protein
MIFSILLFATIIFLVAYTSFNWLWANYFAPSKAFPDQKYFTFGIRVNIPVAIGYAVCTLVAALLCIKHISSNIHPKVFFGSFISSIFVAIYFFLYDFIPSTLNTYFIVLLLFSMPILAIVANVASFRIFGRSNRNL